MIRKYANNLSKYLFKSPHPPGLAFIVSDMLNIRFSNLYPQLVSWLAKPHLDFACVQKKLAKIHPGF